VKLSTEISGRREARLPPSEPPGSLGGFFICAWTGGTCFTGRARYNVDRPSPSEPLGSIRPGCVASDDKTLSDQNKTGERQFCLWRTGRRG
jgi:hypothetical protein